MIPKIPETNRVLVIDDSEFIHKLISARLSPEGLLVEGELTGEAGIRRAARTLPDLILLDVDMPGLDGFEVARRLKETQATRNIPLIFLTGKGDTQSKVRGLDIGAVDYVTKPFDQVELLARVRAALRTKRLQDLLEHQSFVDGLTGLWNRRFLELRVDSELAVVRRNQRPLSLILIDIDHFKEINDNYGHSLGDTVLRDVARTLRANVDASDVVARYGGEEFAVVLSDTELWIAAKVAERLRRKVLGQAHAAPGRSLSISASFGVASTAALQHVATQEALLRASDQALYAAKNAGRNACYVFDRGEVRPFSR